LFVHDGTPPKLDSGFFFRCEPCYRPAVLWNKLCRDVPRANAVRRGIWVCNLVILRLATQAMAGEPPERAAARARRLAEKRAKMEAAKVELAQRDAAADDEKASKVAIREQLKPRMEAWQKGKQVGRDSRLIYLCLCHCRLVGLCGGMRRGINALAVPVGMRSSVVLGLLNVCADGKLRCC